jgi:hypothetical protein
MGRHELADPTTPNPTGSSNSLSGVACSSVSACTAVGTGTGSALAERWDGTTWTLQSTPDTAGYTLSGVACPTSSTCFAVGNNVNDFAVAERWNGTTWQAQPTPRPAGTRLSILTAVSCASSAACTAVGYTAVHSTFDVTLAERWNGTTWGIQPTPNPAKAQDSTLYAVGRPSPSAAIAVGDYNFGGLTLSERWHSTRGTTRATSNPP